jgi:hypothetical protein
VADDVVRSRAVREEKGDQRGGESVAIHRGVPRRYRTEARILDLK